MLKAIRANGAEAWYMLAKDEGHGFQKQKNRDALNAAIAAFLKSETCWGSGGNWRVKLANRRGGA